MKYFNLTSNVFKMKIIPQSFMMIREYYNLIKNDHVHIKPIDSLSTGFVIIYLNGKEYAEDNWYGFQSLQSEDIIEMPLKRYLKLKAFF